MDWVNEHTDETVRFFAIEMAAVKIGDSLPAPLLRVVSQPNNWQKHVRSSTAEASSGGLASLYVEFWSTLLERMRTERPGWRRPARPSSLNWMMIRTVGGVGLSVSFAAGARIRTELYIDTGDAEQNFRIFRTLSDHAEEIAALFQHPVDWEELPGKRACRIADYKPGDVRETDRHAEYVAWFLEGIGRWNQVLDRYAHEVKLAAAVVKTVG